MNLVLWVKVDINLVPAESPIGIDGKQRNSAIFHVELGNPSPLTTSESLQDEE
jgi:hypothetical protein